MEADAFIAELWSYAAEVPMSSIPGSTASSNTAGRRNRLFSARCSITCACARSDFLRLQRDQRCRSQGIHVMQAVLENFMEEVGGKRTHVDIPAAIPRSRRNHPRRGGRCGARARHA